MGRVSVITLQISIIFIGLVVLLLLAFWLPVTAKEAAILNPSYSYLKIPLMTGLYTTSIPFYFSLYQAWKLLFFIERECLFSKQAVGALAFIKKVPL
ncbi:DUF2975 domain-containing protein [Bacillus sp. 1P06AnD]